MKERRIRISTFRMRMRKIWWLSNVTCILHLHLHHDLHPPPASREPRAGSSKFGKREKTFPELSTTLSVGVDRWICILCADIGSRAILSSLSGEFSSNLFYLHYCEICLNFSLIFKTFSYSPSLNNSFFCDI